MFQCSWLNLQNVRTPNGFTAWMSRSFSLATYFCRNLRLLPTGSPCRCLLLTHMSMARLELLEQFIALGDCSCILHLLALERADRMLFVPMYQPPISDRVWVVLLRENRDCWVRICLLLRPFRMPTQAPKCRCACQPACQPWQHVP
jgi:hypothetical protein